MVSEAREKKKGNGKWEMGIGNWELGDPKSGKWEWEWEPNTFPVPLPLPAVAVSPVPTSHFPIPHRLVVRRPDLADENGREQREDERLDEDHQELEHHDE